MATEELLSDATLCASQSAAVTFAPKGAWVRERLPYGSHSQANINRNAAATVTSKTSGECHDLRGGGEAYAKKFLYTDDEVK